MPSPLPPTYYELEIRRRLAVELFRRSSTGSLIHLFFIPAVVLGTGYLSLRPVYGSVLLVLSMLNAGARTVTALRAYRESRNELWDIAPSLLVLRILLLAQTLIWALLAGSMIFEYRFTPTGWLVLSAGIGWTLSIPLVVATDSGIAKTLVIASSIPYIVFCLRFSQLSGFLGIALATGMAAFAYLFVVLQHGYVRGLIEAKLDLEIKQAQLESAQEELRASTAAAEQASAAKGQFLANMSHEIRTPLNGILGLSDMLSNRGNQRESDRELVEELNGSARHLLAIVNDILDFSKITAGKVQIESVPVNLPDLLRACATPFRQLAHSKDLALVIDFAPDLPRLVFTDPVRLRQVIANLLANALKFTNQGQVFLSAHAEGETLHIAVSDTGIGIAQDRLSRIFEEFAQAESSTTRRYGGTGLGLAISRSLAGLMGGSLDVESEVGRGSRFLLRIPLIAEGLDAGRSANDSPDAGMPPFQVPAGFRILAVDDNAVNRRVCRHFLEKAGGVVEVASSAREAIAMHCDRPFDLIFMDCHMPEMDGWEATRAIRALSDPEAATVPVVALTANVMQDVKQLCEQSGMNGHVGKPIVMEELFDVLRSYTSTQRANDVERQPGARIG